MVAGWTDAMWGMIEEADAAPQVGGACLGFPDHAIDFLKGGAVQANMKTGTRRSVRRVCVVMGSGKGKVHTGA